MAHRPTLFEVLAREVSSWRTSYARERDKARASMDSAGRKAPALPRADALRAQIHQHCVALAAAGDQDALRVIEHIASRAVMGGKQYGNLDLAKDRRDWRREALEEAVDGLFYMACRALVREEKAK